MNKLGVVIGALLIAGCASSPDKIGAVYVSPLQYQNYDCKQIVMEMERVGRRVGELQSNLKQKADSDSGKMAVGMILFWPALFFLDGNSVEAQEYARLKGERDTLEKVVIEKKCDIEKKPAPVDTKQTS